ncbi:GHMP kinase [Puniceicoccales bacterium CK1056]|uniref:GHMP kinase n=1 Tax=Oceanipulchritudo coccoides TaxID=2706888 RepID=A0A6B2M5H1_9BACT|nr:GHMP kinase [Oceanipulchritudo coccoides]NDV63055.1 GHMP kinase [Oceanipulchritudo coccoides]
MLIRTKAYARAGLIGNPSDGYNGKTIAFTFDAFHASIELWESPELELLPSRRDHSVFAGLNDLHGDVQKHGYYGGFRLLKATCKVFFDYCQSRGITLDDRNFTLRYKSNIPNQVGLAGSSAIITACARALMGFYNVAISRHSLANLVLAVENCELAIPAGLQDRVAQAYGGLVYMDFDKQLMDERGYGTYELLDPTPIANALYIAYREDLSQGTEVYHNDLRTRFKKHDPQVLEAIQKWANLTEEFRDTMSRVFRPGNSANPSTEEFLQPGLPVPRSNGEVGKDRLISSLSALLNENFDLRAALFDVGDGNRELVNTARSFGASAKFAGSGGAIVGLIEDDDPYEAMKAKFETMGVRVLRPRVV